MDNDFKIPWDYCHQCFVNQWISEALSSDRQKKAAASLAKLNKQELTTSELNAELIELGRELGFVLQIRKRNISRSSGSAAISESNR